MANAKKNIADTVWDLILPTVNELGCSLWDVEYVKEGARQILRVTIDKENGVVVVDYPGSYDPVPGMIIYFYNIPEELDAPGEYFIGDDAVLYYYPGENFETATFSLPVLEEIIHIGGADLIFQNYHRIFDIRGKTCKIRCQLH